MKDEQERFQVDGTSYKTEIPEGYQRKSFKGMPDPRSVQAIIPGTVIDIRVKVGQAITAGQVLLILEAMKMRNEVEAEISGRIARISVSVGDTVKKNQLMVKIEQ